MSTPAQEKLAKKLIAVLGKEDAIELIKHIPDHPTDPDHKISDLCTILETPPEKLIQNHLNSGKAGIIDFLGFSNCEEKYSIHFEVSRSKIYPEVRPQFDVDIIVSKKTVLAAELVLDKMREYLRKIFRADSFPVKNASLGKVSVKV